MEIELSENLGYKKHEKKTNNHRDSTSSKSLRSGLTGTTSQRACRRANGITYTASMISPSFLR
jgi:hypothetical protein